MSIAALTVGDARAASLLDMLFPPRTTTTTSTSSTTTSSTSSTTTSSTSTTSTTLPPAGSDQLTLQDTGLTRLRFTIDNAADWMYVGPRGTTILAAKAVSTTGAAQVTSLGPNLSVNGVGTAIIDVILRVPVGSTTDYYMCKNYKGPTTVTVTRLTTDTPTEIAKLVDTASTPPPKGECEGQMIQPVSRAALIGPVRWPPRQDSRPLGRAHN
jgi:hypothetical protein